MAGHAQQEHEYEEGVRDGRGAPTVRGIAAVMLLFQMGQEAGRYPIDI
jgi:hypothetical protein